MAKTLRPVRTGYTWDPKSLRYRSPTGRFVSQRAFKQSFNAHIRKATREIESLAREVESGKLSVADWQTRMKNEIKTVHLESAAAARGGWAQMTKSDFGKVGAGLKFHYKKLKGFAKDIAAGKLPLGTIVARAAMYATAGGGVYENTRRDEAGEVFTEERRKLAKSEHCPTCKEEAAKGWAKVGTLRKIGDSECMTRCLCRFLFR